MNFNPWRWKGEDELLTAFFLTLAKALDEELKTTTEKVGDLLNKYSFILKAVKLDDVAKGAGSLMSAESLDQLRDKISEILRNSGRRVVVVADDIDRLEKSEIQGLFRIVKLTADFDSVAYVLAFDEAMVSSALGERFSTDSSKSEVAGRKAVRTNLTSTKPCIATFPKAGHPRNTATRCHWPRSRNLEPPLWPELHRRAGGLRTAALGCRASASTPELARA